MDITRPHYWTFRTRHLRCEAKDIPFDSGVYFLFDKDGKVIYIGISDSIKKRLACHNIEYFTFSVMEDGKLPNDKESFEIMFLSVYCPNCNSSNTSSSFISEDYYEKVVKKRESIIEQLLREEVIRKTKEELFK